MKCKRCGAPVKTHSKGDVESGECANGHGFMREAKPKGKLRGCCAKGYEWRGKIYTCQALANELNLSSIKLKIRFKLGMSVEEAVASIRTAEASA